MNKKTAILSFLVMLAALIGCKEVREAKTATVADEHNGESASVIEAKSDVIAETDTLIIDPEQPEIIISEKLPLIQAEIAASTQVKQDEPIETEIAAKIEQIAVKPPSNVDSEVEKSEKIADVTEETGDKTAGNNQVIEEDLEEKTQEPQPEKNKEVIADNTSPENDAELPKTTADIFYAEYNKVLANYVNKDGNVNYSRLRRKRGELFTAVKALDKIKPEEFMAFSKNEKKAFWINAHNIFTLKLIIDNYPIQPITLMGRKLMILYPDNSIMQIPGGREKTIFNVIRFEYTLKEIEREQLLKDFKDPRVIFALTYASKGAAFLRPEAYKAEKLDEQLDDQVRKFVRNNKGLKINRTERIVHLSDMFNWYKQELLESKYGKIKKFRKYKPHVRASLNLIANYLTDEDAEFIESQNYTVKFQIFDWHLNEQPIKK